MSIVKEVTPAQAKNLVTPSAIAGPSRPAREDKREGYRRAQRVDRLEPARQFALRTRSDHGLAGREAAQPRRPFAEQRGE